MSWDKAGTTLSGKFGGIEQYYVPGYGYREQGHIATEPCGACGRGEDVTFTLPLDLYDKLGEIKTGTPIRAHGRSSASRPSHEAPELDTHSEACRRQRREEPAERVHAQASRWLHRSRSAGDGR